MFSWLCFSILKIDMTYKYKGYRGVKKDKLVLVSDFLKLSILSLIPIFNIVLGWLCVFGIGFRTNTELFIIKNITECEAFKDSSVDEKEYILNRLNEFFEKNIFLSLESKSTALNLANQVKEIIYRK